MERLDDLKTFFREIFDDERAFTVMKAIKSSTGGENNKDKEAP